MRPHAVEQRQLAGKESARDAHLVATLQTWSLWQLDQPVVLAPLEISNHLVGHLRRPVTIEHQAQHAGRPERRMPLKLNQNEGVTKKQCRCLHAGLARWRNALNAESLGSQWV